MRKALKVGVVFGILLLGTEIGLRFVLGNFAQSALVELVDDPELCLVLGKNRHLEYTGWWGKVDGTLMGSNTFGSREDRNDKSDKKQIFMIGDSFTYGQGVNQEDSLPALVQAEIPDVDVWNFGVPGRDFFQFAAEIQRLKSLKPDLILLNIFANDFDLAPKTCMFSEADSWQLPVMRQCYLCRLGLFTFMMNQSKTEIPRQEMEIAILSELQKIQKTVKGEEIELIIVFLTDESTMIGEKKELPDIRALIKHRAAKNMDLSYTWEELTMNPEEYTIPNEFHLNAEGNQILAKEYVKQLKSLLKD
jgi:lysophospholipase L1-like esterase